MQDDPEYVRTDHWAEWFKAMSEREDKDNFRYIVSFTTGAPFGFGVGYDSLDKLSEAVERCKMPVIIAHQPHAMIIVIPKHPQVFEL
jgi:uncharacterized protein YfeS